MIRNEFATSCFFSEMHARINLFFNSIAPPTALNTGCEGFIALSKEPNSF